MSEQDIHQIIGLIRQEDGRYSKEAYEFVRVGLEHVVKEIRAKDALRVKISRHVTGQELADGLRGYALEQFGPMAQTVLETWGIKETIDFGNIVYNLIEYSVFSKTDSDRREDFLEVYDFEEAFARPFWPKSRPVIRVKAEELED